MSRWLRPSRWRARALRRVSTPAERALWARPRNRAVAGARFRRQQPAGPYFVDLFYAEVNLVVEVDGSQHRPPPPREVARDARLRAAGCTVVRFRNDEVSGDTDSVVRRIAEWVGALCPSPLPPGEGLG